ncbi:MAG TPA: helix-turn-helix transcriptional regulator [Candidatus Ornithomonoglobus intestinigallinarum]|uniref:Helix-turn-helix transcriptional regulator n=1 Tax=Candidatus Ornithomonoglobus intestinigallinarum TaxID=2840894 RepID=A0A9D1KRF8_9FIRM|nr:helix-turn-helix transcriptional regulator [Candidatus Ornithomonoglobus intestinigallinarum]
MSVEIIDEQCSTCKYNPRILEKIKNELPDEKMTASISDVFKVFADNTRIRILWTLFDKEMCVYDISEKLGMTQSAISHQLRTLKQARLVKARRDGKNTFYSLDDEHVKRIIEQVLIHLEEE